MLALTENATAVGARPGAAGVADRGSLCALARFGRREPLPESGRVTQVCSADVAQAVIGLFTRAIARERPALQPATCVQMASVSRPARGALRGVAAGAERLVLLLHLRARNPIAARAACALRLDLPRPLLLAHCERAALALVTRLAHIGAHVTLENVPVVSLRAVARLVVDCLEARDVLPCILSARHARHIYCPRLVCHLDACSQPAASPSRLGSAGWVKGGNERPQYSVIVAAETLSVVLIRPCSTANVRKEALPKLSAELWSRRKSGGRKAPWRPRVSVMR